MAPKYKLTYFPVKALAEPICYLLAYGGQEFENVRFDVQNWPQIKPGMPFGQVPVLEIDGKKTHQSIAICRFLANEYGLAGKDNWENYLIDCTVDCINDLRAKMALYWYDPDEKSKQQRKTVLFNETLPFYLDRLDAQVKENKGHFVNGKLTWADIYFTGLSDYLDMISGGILLDKHANLKALKQKVMDIPGIKAWAAAHPYKK